MDYDFLNNEDLNFQEYLLEEPNHDYRYEILRFRKTLLFKGNALCSSTFEKEFIDLIVTSPPYNVGIDYKSNDDELNYEQYLDFSKIWMKNCYQWSVCIS